MEKNIILIVFILLSASLLQAQNRENKIPWECFTSSEETSPSASPGSESNSEYYPEMPPKTMRVNIHYLLKDDGTGNFTETGDNYTNRPYNGYLHAYAHYIMSVDSNDIGYLYSTLINHEVGHCFNLPHAIQDCCIGKKCSGCDDGIEDTPNFWELVKELHYLPCEWNHILGSNNMMDYCADQNALSPMQIAQMHAYIDGPKLYYRNCKYKTPTLGISNFTTNKAYIAKQVAIPSRYNIVVSNHSALFVNAEEFTINGQLELQSGSILNVEIVPACD